MVHLVHELEAELMQLPAQDRAHLAARLIDSLEPASDHLASWAHAALEREQRHDAGLSQAAPMELVLARLRGALR